MSEIPNQIAAHLNANLLDDVCVEYLCGGRQNELRKSIAQNYLRECHDFISYEEALVRTQNYGLSHLLSIVHQGAAECLEYNGADIVAKKDKFLYWKELVEKGDGDLYACSLSGIPQLNACNWSYFIKCEDPQLRHIFEGNASDIHLHLAGSGQIFFQNWLSLHRYSDFSLAFSDSKKARFENLYGRGSFEDFKRLSYLCVGLRLKLFQLLRSSNAKRVNICNLIRWYVSHDSLIATEGTVKQFTHLSISLKRLKYDYAEALLPSNSKADNIRSGERALLRQTIHRLSSNPSTKESMLFWAYLIAKKQLMNYFIHTKGGCGFREFKKRFQCHGMFNGVPLLTASHEYGVAKTLTEKPYLNMVEFRIGSDNIPLLPKRMSKVINLVNREHRLTSTPYHYGFVIHLIKRRLLI